MSKATLRAERDLAITERDAAVAERDEARSDAQARFKLLMDAERRLEQLETRSQDANMRAEEWAMWLALPAYQRELVWESLCTELEKSLRIARDECNRGFYALSDRMTSNASAFIVALAMLGCVYSKHQERAHEGAGQTVEGG